MGKHYVLVHGIHYLKFGLNTNTAANTIFSPFSSLFLLSQLHYYSPYTDFFTSHHSSSHPHPHSLSHLFFLASIHWFTVSLPIISLCLVCFHWFFVLIIVYWLFLCCWWMVSINTLIINPSSVTQSTMTQIPIQKMDIVELCTSLHDCFFSHIIIAPVCRVWLSLCCCCYVTCML